MFLLTSTGYAADKGVENNNIFNTFFNIDITYKAKFDLENIMSKGTVCSASEGDKYRAGKESIFREISSNEQEVLVIFDYVKDDGKKKGMLVEINTPYKLCRKELQSYKYRRVGGMDAGALVVPFKMRSGDLYGDPTLGSYVAFKGNYISLLATFGITQISVPDIETGEVTTESGFSYALGLIWSITDSFDVGLVAGVDHLSGRAGDDFEFQDDIWWSLAIGHNFTTGL